MPATCIWPTHPSWQASAEPKIRRDVRRELMQVNEGPSLDWPGCRQSSGEDGVPFKRTVRPEDRFSPSGVVVVDFDDEGCARRSDPVESTVDVAMPNVALGREHEAFGPTAQVFCGAGDTNLSFWAQTHQDRAA